MLYLIAEQLGFPGVLNLIRYISFRAGAASATALAIGLLLGPWFISYLRERQGRGQPIRADGPQTHDNRNARTYDIVLLGATGFTGELTAAYLAEHAPTDCRWALAGRNRAKLEAVRDRLATKDAALAELPLVIADSSDAASLRSLAESARVVITTVGPYLAYGEPLVAACAAAGTDYVDLTGEPEFVVLSDPEGNRFCVEGRRR